MCDLDLWTPFPATAQLTVALELFFKTLSPLVLWYHYWCRDNWLTDLRLCLICLLHSIRWMVWHPCFLPVDFQFHIIFSSSNTLKMDTFTAFINCDMDSMILNMHVGSFFMHVYSQSHQDFLLSLHIIWLLRLPSGAQLWAFESKCCLSTDSPESSDTLSHWSWVLCL